MSDRIAVMNGGRVEQVGTPADIYNRPSTRFAADFIGDTNLISGSVVSDAGGSRLVCADGFSVAAPAAAAGEIHCALRPEKIALMPAYTDQLSNASGHVEGINFLGSAILYRIDIGGGRRLLVKSTNTDRSQIFAPGSPIKLSWKPQDLIVLNG